jgi:hypothetical protein
MHDYITYTLSKYSRIDWNIKRVEEYLITTDLFLSSINLFICKLIHSSSRTLPPTIPIHPSTMQWFSHTFSMQANSGSSSLGKLKIRLVEKPADKDSNAELIKAV